MDHSHADTKRVRARSLAHAVSAGRIDRLGAVEALGMPVKWALVETGEAEDMAEQEISVWDIATP